MTSSKSRLVKEFSQFLEGELEAAMSAAKATYEAATHEESQPENEYDTRGLEASYLAGAQAKRVKEIEDVLGLFHSLDFKHFGANDVIQATALVELAHEGKRSFVLLLPKGGGFSIKFDEKTVQIVTPQSLLGEALVGLRIGDVAEVETHGSLREYEVIGLS